ncbi:hypothetical protein MKK68_06960 [Methylobacterium sp. E-016]|uniref:hypothetical protein n=1 Tax=Methylobacterium sp. E-016 TaxID=2836556 RepID=UPI001FBB094E|nr:hypothetical protein [Methylobacterium sp. E-016]MCJ2075399.1 hypothetical protein [Methylobacterium sp. E-016]
MNTNKFWWATVHDHDRPEVVEVTFENGKPHRVYLSGTDVDIEPYELDACVRLIEQVLPPGRAAAAVEKLEEIAGEKWPWIVVEEISAILQGGPGA